jgi:hypothetical protein
LWRGRQEAHLSNDSLEKEIIMKTDDWFKPLLMFLIIIFLINFYWYSQNGRYTFNFDNNTHTVADTRTGNLYTMSSGKAYKIEVTLGKITTSPIQSNDPSFNTKLPSNQ